MAEDRRMAIYPTLVGGCRHGELVPPEALELSMVIIAPDLTIDAERRTLHTYQWRQYAPSDASCGVKFLMCVEADEHEALARVWDFLINTALPAADA